MNFKDFYSSKSEQNLFKVYHGGKKWVFVPKELIASKKNRHNYGVGIYSTNKLNTARAYGKGSRVVHELTVDKNYKELDDVFIDVGECIDFVKTLNGLRKKQILIKSLQDYSDRIKNTNIPISILHNLIHNYDAAPGLLGKRVSDFLVSKGVDANYVRQSGDEFWFVIFNPKIIKSFRVVDPKQEGKEFPFELSDIKNPVN